MTFLYYFCSPLVSFGVVFHLLCQFTLFTVVRLVMFKKSMYLNGLFYFIFLLASALSALTVVTPLPVIKIERKGPQWRS